MTDISILISNPSLAGASAAGLLLFSIWIVSLVIRDASIIDMFWGGGFAVIAATSRGASRPHDGHSLRAMARGERQEGQVKALPGQLEIHLSRQAEWRTSLHFGHCDQFGVGLSR